MLGLILARRRALTDTFLVPISSKNSLDHKIIQGGAKPIELSQRYLRGRGRLNLRMVSSFEINVEICAGERSLIAVIR
jgi:hypothetical protein